MIDRKARNELANLVRAFATGTITNFDFERNSPFSEDKIISVIDDYLWSFYDDFKEHKLPKGSLPLTTKKEIARIVLFLDSELEYQWPIEGGLIKRILKLFKSSPAIQAKKIKDFDYHNAGDLSVWPFQNRKHLIAEAKKQRVGLSLTLADS